MQAKEIKNRESSSSDPAATFLVGEIAKAHLSGASAFGSLASPGQSPKAIKTDSSCFWTTKIVC